MEICIFILPIPAVEVNRKDLIKTKFTPEVIAALQTLKNAAESDFEKHRIAVLEKDLTEPPKVEIIDDTHQKFDGVNYFADKQGHYRATFHIHRAVYTYYYGDIPPEHDIHHIDGNKANNDISNLLLVTRSEHQKLHKPKGNAAVVYNTPHTFVCNQCGKTFSTTNTRQNTFCSKECRDLATHRYEYRHCVICGKRFRVRSDAKTQTCSFDCSNKMWRSKLVLKEKICAQCGNKFLTNNDRKIYCSHSCALRHHRSKNKI